MELNRSKILIISIVTLFMLSRFFGLGQLYTQDEYRWVSIVSEVFGKLDSPHPPVTEVLYSWAGTVFGYDNLRTLPFIMSIFCLILIYLISLKLGGDNKVAYIAVGLFTINVYSLIANLQIDMDGAILPFFVLLSYYFYLQAIKDRDKRFILPFAIAMVGGFLTKLSFILFVGALAVDYLWVLYDDGRLKANLKKLIFGFGGAIISVVVLYVLYGSSHPWFVEYIIKRSETFISGSRSYFDLFLRLFKFFIWLSPLLFLPMVYGFFKKEIFRRYRLWYIYTLFNFLFYIVIFDFTRLPIERYFMFIIGPAVIIAADVIYSLVLKLNMSDRFKINKKYLLLGVAGLALLTVFTVVVSQDVVPLNPKEAYVDKVKSFDFNFLIPLTGGSGPIGFYASAQFILWAWVVCAIGLLFSRKIWAIYLFLIFGLGYNILLSNEHLFGSFYGSVNNITKQSVDYVLDDKDIKEVITYYDAGVYYLRIGGKYSARFYTAPTRDYSARINAYRNHYMIVDFPAIDKNSQYWKLISRCKLDNKLTDKYVDSYFFDCRSLPPST